MTIIYQSEAGFVNLPNAGLNKNIYTFVILNDVSTASDLPVARDFILTPHDKTRIILIKPKSQDVFESGTVMFLSVDDYVALYGGTLDDPEKYTSSYFGKASLYASIFAGSKERYECGMSKAMERLQLITLIQYYKTISVEPYISRSCGSYVIGVNEPVELRGARYLLESFNKTISADVFGEDTADKMISYISKLEQLNNKIIVEANCPLIY
jgi:hypothetical protein